VEIVGLMRSFHPQESYVSDVTGQLRFFGMKNAIGVSELIKKEKEQAYLYFPSKGCQIS